MDRIPVLKPKLPTAPSVVSYLASMDLSGIYSNHGPLVRQLEQKYSLFCNVSPDNVVCLANATLGIQAAIELIEFDSWIVPDFTFAATGTAVANSKKNLLLSDVSQTDWILDANSLSLNYRESAGIIPVMPFGAKPDLRIWESWDAVVIDAAASLGSGPFDFKSLPDNWVVVFSLHATKVLGAGEGAFLVCGSKLIADKIRAWINFGFNSDRKSVQRGTNGKMSEISAAYALASLDLFDQEQKEWSRVQNEIRKQIVGTSLENVTTSYSGFNPYWILQLENSSKLIELQQLLAKHGIESRKWWPHTISEMPGIKSKKITETKNSINLAGSTLGLPKFRDLETKDIERIAQITRNFSS